MSHFPLPLCRHGTIVPLVVLVLLILAPVWTEAVGKRVRKPKASKTPPLHQQAQQVPPPGTQLGDPRLLRPDQLPDNELRVLLDDATTGAAVGPSHSLIRLVDYWTSPAGGVSGGIHAGSAHCRCLLALLTRVRPGGSGRRSSGPPASWALAASPSERAGFTLLHHAVLAKNLALTTVLLQLGADPGQPAAGCGLTALHMVR